MYFFIVSCISSESHEARARSMIFKYDQASSGVNCTCNKCAVMSSGKSHYVLFVLKLKMFQSQYSRRASVI